jgi:hypothetical protein
MAHGFWREQRSMDNLGTSLAPDLDVLVLTATQEWKHHLRSSLHPYIFAGVYRLLDLISHAADLSPAYRAEALISGPKVLQAGIAAVGDYYTWKLAEKAYGAKTPEAWAAVGLSIENARLIPVPRLIISCDVAACSHHHQSMAVVCFYPHILELFGD